MKDAFLDSIERPLLKYGTLGILAIALFAGCRETVQNQLSAVTPSSTTMVKESINSELPSTPIASTPLEQLIFQACYVDNRLALLAYLRENQDIKTHVSSISQKEQLVFIGSWCRSELSPAIINDPVASTQ